MSLRKSPQLTPRLLIATRQNAQSSTGARSADAKQNSKLNAMKHGAYASDENQQQFRLREMAQGEDFELFQTLRQELLHLLDEEIASLPEEFQYAEKAYEDSVPIDRDACLAPEGETWSMMLRQEAALDRSIDRKVRILLRMREESNNPPIPLPGQTDGGGKLQQIENMSPESDI